MKERRGYTSLTNDYMFKNMSHLRERPKVFDEKEFDRLFEIAGNLLAMGLSAEQVMNATGLSEEQVRSLTVK